MPDTSRSIAATPEERLAAPLVWDPGEIPPEAISQLELIINLAVQSNRVDPKVGKWMLRIIQVNPHRRLSRLGQRIALLRSVLDEFTSIDRRVRITMEGLEEEHRTLAAIISSHPTWEIPPEEMDRNENLT